MELREITDFINGLIDSSPDNSLGNGARAWQYAVTACAAGDDPYWAFYKGDMGVNYMTPAEWLRASHPEEACADEDVSVVSWVLKPSEDTLAAQETAKRLVSEPWARTRTFGEAFNRLLGARVEAELRARGISAVAPLKSPLFAVGESPKYGKCSNWSERHAAFVAGLGTFGLCDGLISPIGKAVRYGSVILKARVAPTPRPYTGTHDYCLFHQGKGCMACAARCPAGAITAAGHDKEKCLRYNATLKNECQPIYGFEGVYGCGLCQVCVPCERGIPKSV